MDHLVRLMITTIKINGSDAVINSLSRKRLNFSNVIQTAVRVAGIQIEKQAKINAPSKTGNLRRSILSEYSHVGNTYTSRVTPDYKTLGGTPEKNYGIFVEMGHAQEPGRYVPAIGKRLVASWVEGKWYMAKTGIQMKQQVENNLKNAFRKAMI